MIRFPTARPRLVFRRPKARDRRPSVLYRLAAWSRHCHDWKAREILWGDHDVVQRQHCVGCQGWRFRYDDGRRLSPLEERLLERFRVQGLVAFRPLGRR